MATHETALRIALLARECSPGYTGGGIGTYTTYLAAGLHEIGCDVTVVGRHDGDWLEQRHEAGFRLVYAPLRRLPDRVRMRAPAIADRIEAAREARAAIRRLGRFDVVESGDWLAEGLLLPRSTAALHARHVHGGSRTLRQHSDRVAPTMERRADVLEAWDLRRADVITVASRLSHRLPDGRSVLPRGSRPQLFPMPVRLDGWEDSPAGDAPRVLTVLGRLEPRKGPDLLIRAVASLRAEMPDLVVRLVGSDIPTATGGSYAEQLTALADDLGVGLDVVGARPAEAIAGLLAGSRVVVVPSRFESFSMVALEALAARRPVVISDACGAAETLSDAVGVLAFPSGDVAALAARLGQVLADPAVATSLGDAGRRHVESVHSPAASAAAKVAIWRRALAAGQPD